MNLSKLIKKEILFIIISSISVLIAFLGLTYGYVVYNSNNTETHVTVGSGDFVIIYTDTQVLTGTNIDPGWSQNKTVTVRNTGNKTAYYNLKWERLLNEAELQISVTCSSNIQGNTCEGFSKPIPIYTTEVTNKTIKAGIPIAAGETHTYVVTVSFLESASLTLDYSSSKTFRGTLNITTGDVHPLYTVMKNLAAGNTYAKTYTGESNDSYGRTGTQKIYYIRTSSGNNTTQANELINNKINVKFAGFCWQILRTTDTGGIRLIYNGEPDSNGYCLRQDDTTVTHKGVVALSGGSAVTMTSNYQFADSFTYDLDNETFTLVNSSEDNYATNKNLKGKYTCMTSNTTITCPTLSFINEANRSSVNKPYVVQYKIDSTQNSQIGTTTFNAIGNSPAYVGYKFGDVYSYSGETAPTGIMGNNVYWNGGNYELIEFDDSVSTDTTYDATHHYMCNNETAICDDGKVRYYYYNNYYIIFENGEIADDAVRKMLTNSSNTDDSVIKSYVENWYYNNIYGTKYNDYVDQDAVYCNDRSISSLGGWGGKYANGVTAALFNTYNEITDLSCVNNTDKFSKSNSSASLIYPIGLPTIPEMAMINNNTVRKTTQYYWLISPSYTAASNMYGRAINNNGGSVRPNDKSNYGVRPVITLAPINDTVTGTGSLTDPYVIE